jgi:hypothetical protein
MLSLWCGKLNQQLAGMPGMGPRIRRDDGFGPTKPLAARRRPDQGYEK